MAEPGGARFFEAVRLVAGLRLKAFYRRLLGRGVLGSAAALLLFLGLAGGLGAGSYLLFAKVRGIVESPVWMAFSLGLFCFLLSLFWVIWPVVAAQVDDAFELGRLLGYPIRPARLYLIQTAVALLEPSGAFFYPALLGAGLGLARSLQPGAGASIGLMLCYVLMNVCAGRALLNLFLNLMKSRRSGEWLALGFGVLLLLSVFLPPVDSSWLFGGLAEFGATSEGQAVLAQNARAFGLLPPGWLARGLAAAAAGETGDAAGAAGAMLGMAGAAFALGLWWLLRFYRGGRDGRARPRRPGPRRHPRGLHLPGLPETVAAVFEREIATLRRSPKGRMLFSVPFFLLILLRIIGAPDLLRYLWGEAWASLLVSCLCLYVLSVMGGQVLANGFGFDGPAVRWVFLAPAAPAHWLIGRNLAQGVFVAAQCGLLAALCYGFLPGARLDGWAIPAAGMALLLPVMLAAGNRISCRYPRRFHLNLSRRDRPVPEGFFLMLATLGAGLLAFLSLLALAALAASRGFGGTGETARGLAAGLLLPASLLGGGWFYRRMLAGSARTLRSRREEIVAEIAR